MKTDFFDKLLIALLIVIIPITIVIASRYEKKNEEDSIAEVKVLSEQKIDQVIEEIKNQPKVTPEPKVAPITISSVGYDKNNKLLMVKGIAPGKNFTVMVSAIETQHKAPKKIVAKTKTASGSAEASNSATLAQKEESLDELVLGEAVEVKAVKTDGDGQFTYVYKENENKVALVDLRFDQSDSTATIQYNFVDNKRTF